MLKRYVFRFFIKAESRAVTAFRTYSWLHRKGYRNLALYLYNRAKLKYGIDIAPGAKIGEGFKIIHLGGIIIGKDVIIGDNVSINSGVTLGMRKRNENSMPVIEDDVYLSTGCKILGGVNVGSGSTVAANAVLLKDLPCNSLAVGIPAKVIRR